MPPLTFTHRPTYTKYNKLDCGIHYNNCFNICYFWFAVILPLFHFYTLEQSIRILVFLYTSRDEYAYAWVRGHQRIQICVRISILIF